MPYLAVDYRKNLIQNHRINEVEIYFFSQFLRVSKKLFVFTIQIFIINILTFLFLQNNEAYDNSSLPANSYFLNQYI